MLSEEILLINRKPNARSDDYIRDNLIINILYFPFNVILKS